MGGRKDGAEEKKEECVVLNKVRSEVQRDCSAAADSKLRFSPPSLSFCPSLPPSLL